MKRIAIIMIFFSIVPFCLPARQSTDTWNQSGFSISERDTSEFYPVSAYNFLEDEFIVVWHDGRLGKNDIFGRILHGDGTPRTPVFPVFTEGTSNWFPYVAYNRIDNEYMVVWQDMRREEIGTRDIYGIRLDIDGNKIWSSRSEPDTSFIICNHNSNQILPKISHNYIDNNYLVVWHDNRQGRLSVWGQRLGADAELLPPQDVPDTQINFPIGMDSDLFSDMRPDVAYHGGLDDTLNEWLVVFMRQFVEISEMPIRIWATRVSGESGALLNTWGLEAASAPGARKHMDMGGPPWFPDFPVSWEDTSGVSPMQYFIDGSPHVWSNDYWTPTGSETGISGDNKFVYPVPEFMVSWSSDRVGGMDWNIHVQRIAYFPGSDALSMGLIEQSQNPDAWVCVPLDVHGKTDPHGFWANWHNYAATTHHGYQSWNELNYNQNSGEFLVVWNDWREEGFGSWPTHNPADIYGQHLFINPDDSCLVWTDPIGSPGHDPVVNTAIAASLMDEGNMAYPTVAYSIVENRFLVAYQYADPAAHLYRGIHGMMHDGAPFTSVREITFFPTSILTAQNYPNPFNPETVIAISLPQQGMTNVVIYDILGREIVRVFEEMMPRGDNEVRWNGTDGRGIAVRSGVYFYRIESESKVFTGKMVLIR